MKTNPGPQPPHFGTLKPPRQPTPDELATTEVEAQARRLLARCARLSLQAYDDILPDASMSVFVDEELALQAIACIVEGEAYIAFRGTKGLLLVSTNWRKVNLRASRIGDPPRHRGFQQAWDTIKPKVTAWLKQLHRPVAVNITGHSMGAAVAQLAALELSGDWAVKQVILFATPMIGATDFNQAYDATPVRATSRTLQQVTMRYLLLSDIISLPLPRLLGYKPGLPIQRIDRHGLPTGYVPGLLWQATDQMANNAPLVVVSPTTRCGGVQQSPAHIGEPNVIERQMWVFRMLAMSHGVWGWTALLGLALGNASLRALGFHNMEGYARAFAVPVDEPSKT